MTPAPVLEATVRLASVSARRVHALWQGLGGVWARCAGPPSARQRTVREALDRLADELRADGVDVRLHLAEALPHVRTDPRRLRTLVACMVAGTCPATRGAPGHGILTLTTRRPAGGGVELAIADTGQWVLVVDRGTDGAGGGVPGEGRGG